MSELRPDTSCTEEVLAAEPTQESGSPAPAHEPHLITGRHRCNLTTPSAVRDREPWSTTLPLTFSFPII